MALTPACVRIVPQQPQTQWNQCRALCTAKNVPDSRGSSPGMTNWGWVSPLQLAFELVEKTPVGVVGDDLLRARLDEAGLVQPQRVEPDSVLGVIFPPFVVCILVERLQGVIVAGVKPPSTSLRAAP